MVKSRHEASAAWLANVTRDDLCQFDETVVCPLSSGIDRHHPGLIGNRERRAEFGGEMFGAADLMGLK